MRSSHHIDAWQRSSELQMIGVYREWTDEQLEQMFRRNQHRFIMFMAKYVAAWNDIRISRWNYGDPGVDFLHLGKFRINCIKPRGALIAT